MVGEFKISRIPRIHFGPGKAQLLPDILKQYKGTALVIISNSVELCSKEIQKIKSSISNSYMSYEIVYAHGEPSADSIDEIVYSFRNSNIGLVCAIGGGSIIDTGKAISAMLKEEGSIESYLEVVGHRPVSGAKIPFIAVPTTAGTGSEVTKNAVISKICNEGYKKSLRHENYVPDIAIIDPTLSISCPAHVTAAAGMDAFTQLLESYLSINSNPFTDALAIDGLNAIKNSLLDAFYDGTNLKARSELAYAAMISGITLTNAGLGVVHGFASSIGAFYDIPHGIICGTLLAEVHKANLFALLRQNTHDDQLNKFVLLAKLFFPESELSNYDLLMCFSDLLFDLTKTLQIPKLGKFSITKSNTERILKNTDLKNNPVELSPSVLGELLLNRI